ncbi:MAG: hypothetical protein ABSF89_05770 [Acidimicrobiales bacterium]
MKRDEVERRLLDVHARLVRARQELAVAEEQLDLFLETAEEARIRALVSETPLADRDWQDAQRHAEAMIRGRDNASARVVELERAQDELLSKLVV